MYRVYLVKEDARFRCEYRIIKFVFETVYLQEALHYIREFNRFTDSKHRYIFEEV